MDEHSDDEILVQQNVNFYFLQFHKWVKIDKI